ncbi:MAG: hypothetical protein GOU98_03385 [Candidatus Altiarchaeota archaeon]|nr:hypothetical protein [Candidatus Altiarchaeota archaeon]
MTKKAAIVMAGGKGSRLKKGGVWTAPKPTLNTEQFNVAKNTLLGLPMMGVEKIYYALGHRHKEVEAYVLNVVDGLGCDFECEIAFVLDDVGPQNKGIVKASQKAFRRAAKDGYATAFYTFSDHLLPYNYLVSNGFLMNEDSKKHPSIQLSGVRHSYNNPLDPSKFGTEAYDKGAMVGLAFVEISTSRKLSKKLKVEGTKDIQRFLKSKRLPYVPWFNLNDTKTIGYADQVIEDMGAEASNYFLA